MTLLDKITALARADVPAFIAAEQLGMTYREMSQVIKRESLHANYSEIRESEQKRALSRLNSSIQSTPVLPPIPSRQTRRRRRSPN